MMCSECMTDKDGQHWFRRCSKAAQDWLLHNPGMPLTTEAMDAVIGAGGTLVRRSASGDTQSEAYYLHPSDSAYLVDLRAAGVSVGDR
jgi:hypothetical protein